MKPKIQLVGRRAATVVGSAVDGLEPETSKHRKVTAASCSGKAAVLLEEFLGSIIRSENASAGIVRVLSPDGRQLSLVGCSGLSVEVCRNDSVVDANCGVCGKSLLSGEIESSDAELCINRYGADFSAEACKRVIAVPLSYGDQRGTQSGVLTLFFASAQQETESSVRALRSYAELMHIALSNIWKNEDSHQLSLLAERQSIANEIHDSLAQTLYFAKIRASLLLDAMKSKNELLAFKCAQDIDEALESGQRTVRELVTHFRCQMDPQGLQYALQKLVTEFGARCNIALEYSNQVERLDLPSDYELQVFLIVREALVNIATHSGASAAQLKVSYADGRYLFEIADNGGGIGSSMPPEGHYGLVIMRERALRIGGVIEIESIEKSGTLVQLIFSAPCGLTEKQV